jgi:hypothetical protein
MEPPPASHLDGAFPDGVTDWTKFSMGTLSFHMLDLAAFAHAWAPLERRWDAGGAPAKACTLQKSMQYCYPHVDESWADCLWAPLVDFSRIQPHQPNPWFTVLAIFTKMIGAAGAKEAELQGSSSVMRGNAVTEAVLGET